MGGHSGMKVKDRRQLAPSVVSFHHAGECWDGDQGVSLARAHQYMSSASPTKSSGP